jgi:uncharacterized protein YjiS (DUF1127 family)
MPTRDLLLPPQPYARWRPMQRQHYHPIPPILAAARLIARWIQRDCQRRALAQLDDRMLRDIGITRIEVARECAKPFWR